MKLYNDIIITPNRAITKSYAKINLTLDVLNTLPNGYHEVRMIMQTLNLFDYIVLDKQKCGISLSTDKTLLPNDRGNIAYSAAELFFKETGVHGGIKINIQKNIPIAAGLAGGSSDAAAVLCALNLLYDTNLTDEKLAELGLKLGADVPFCIFGGTQLAEGIGEKLTSLSSLTQMPVVLIKPSCEISTADIYSRIDTSENLSHPDTEAALNAINASDYETLFSHMSNIMENVTAELYPEIHSIKEQLTALGAKAALMSGSGPTVYGIFTDNAAAKKAINTFAGEYDEVFLTHTI